MKRLFILLYILIFLNSFICFNAFSQDSGYRTCVEQGIQRYYNGEWDNAIKLFQAAIADTKANANEKAKAEQWIVKCNTAKKEAAKKQEDMRIAALERFILSTNEIITTCSGKDTVINIETANAWKLQSFPDWCEITDNIYSISIKIAENKSLEPRNGKIEIVSMVSPAKKKPYTLKHEITVQQQGRPVNVINTKFATIPTNALITIDGGKLDLISGNFVELKEGSYHISISKPNYVPFDTTLVIDPFEKCSSKTLTIKLTPEFATANITLATEEGAYLTIENSPVLKIDNRVIELSDLLEGSVPRDFSSNNQLEYYKLYKPNSIPLPAGKHIVNISASGFENYVDTIFVSKGKSTDFSFNLIAKSGKLIINNIENADSCKVFVDKKDVGYAPGEFRVISGLHTITFYKDGFLCPQAAILAEIEENKDYTIDLKMLPYFKYTFNSDPQGANVIFDGEKRWSTPVFNQKVTQGEHSVSFVKEGYLTINRTIHVEDKDDSLFVHMPETNKLDLIADVENLHVIIKNRKTKEIVSSERVTNESVDIPYGKYIIELRRYNKYSMSKEELRTIESQLGVKDLAYKGRLKFDEKHNRKKVLTFSEKGVVLGAQYSFMGISTPSFSPETSTTGSSVSSYRYLGEVNLGKFKIFPGYSTSIVKASAFLADDKNNAVRWGNSSGISGCPLLFNGTVIFLNGEMRIGGAIAEHLDCNILGSYSWTPEFHKWGNLSNDMSFGYISGVDLFIGAEISTRIKAFNVNLRIGEQFYAAGKVNVPNKVIPGCENIKGFYEKEFSSNAFVISLGFTLGKNRGNAMIRVF